MSDFRFILRKKLLKTTSKERPLSRVLTAFHRISVRGSVRENLDESTFLGLLSFAAQFSLSHGGEWTGAVENVVGTNAGTSQPSGLHRSAAGFQPHWFA